MYYSYFFAMRIVYGIQPHLASITHLAIIDCANFSDISALDIVCCPNIGLQDLHLRELPSLSDVSRHVLSGLPSLARIQIQRCRSLFMISGVSVRIFFHRHYYYYHHHFLIIVFFSFFRFMVFSALST